MGSAEEREGAQSEVKQGKICEQALANLRRYLELGRLFILESDSCEAFLRLSAVLRHRKADMVFIDGDHSLAGVLADLMNYRELLGPGGLLCGHDETCGEVRAALRHTLGDWRKGPGSIWWRELGT